MKIPSITIGTLPSSLKRYDPDVLVRTLRRKGD
jgi:hypothetical protein